MFLSKALQHAKRTDDEKVGLHIKVPAGLKNEFDTLCKKHGVSITTMVQSLMEAAIEEDRSSDWKHHLILDAINSQIHELDIWIQNFLSSPDPEEFTKYDEWRTKRDALISLKKEME